MTRRSFSIVSCVSLAALSLIAPSAYAAPVGLSGEPDRMYYEAPPGTENDVSLSLQGGRWVLKDAGVASITVTNPACRTEGTPNVVSCTPYDGLGGLSVAEYWGIRTGDEDDIIRIDKSVPARVADLSGILSLDAGSGNDYVAAGLHGDGFVNTGAGNDIFIGGPGRDAPNAGPGDDQLKGGGGPDVFTGGDGFDTVSYTGEGRTAGVRATLDGGEGSGNELVDGAGDRLNIDIESIVGTPYTDILTGNSSNNTLRGNGGSDLLSGLGGDDTLIATGGPSWLLGGDGNDVIQTKNNAKDFVTCDAGNDSATLDLTETVLPFASCETRIN